MRTSRLLPVLILAFAASLLIGACGDDDDGGSEDESQITEVIETSLTTTDPADCTRLLTQEFVEQTNFTTGEAAVAECEEETKDTADDPDSVEVTNIEVDGSDATADVTFTGSVLDGSTASLALVKEGDQWKLNELTDIPEFDFEAFKTAFADQLAAEGDVPPQIAECISNAIGSASADQVKEVFLSGEEEQLVSLFAECIPGQS